MEAVWRKRRKNRGRTRKRAALGRAAFAAAFLAALALTLVGGYRLKALLNEKRAAELSHTFQTRTPTPAQTLLLPAATPAPGASGAAVPALAQSTATPAPRIVIYHTHATEAYTQTAQYTYKESGSWRTKDESRSVVAVGALLAMQLRDAGYFVLHDTANHEPPKLSSAYSRSEETMRRYVEEYGGVDYFIDVHRDAYGKDASGARDFVLLDGKETARMMFVVGTGEGATGTGFAEMPDYARNLAFAQAVTDVLQKKDARLARDVRIKTGRYNQHLPAVCLLAEVGHNQNTLEQALAAVPQLAAAIDACIKKDASASDAPSAAVWAPQN